VADQHGLSHHEKRLSPEEFGALTAEAARLLDEPLVEPMVGQLLGVCRFARERLTVVLSGEGADETWFGYPSYRLHGAIELLQRALPLPLLRLAVRALDRAAEHVAIPPKVLKHARNLPEPLERRYLGLNQFDVVLKDALYSDDMRNRLRKVDPREATRRLYDGDAGGPEPISRMAAVDCRAWLVDNTLMRSDMMSMATSLELRVPFLDHRLVELASRVPAALKVQPNDQKVILKRALADRVPARIAKRRKAGFPTPLTQLFRGDFGAQAAELFAEPCDTTRALFDHERILGLYREHRDGGADRGVVLCQMMMLELWARAFEAPA
jgi:asparagine synthase (glutamine-hydrolysing)